MSKILKNSTDGVVELVDVGVSIPASGQFTVPPQDYLRFASSSDMIRALSTGIIVLNDGGNDITNLSDAINIIKNWCLH